MALVVWTGNTDGDWNTVTNWSTGALPNAGDDVIFNATSRDVTVSSSVASTNYNSIRVLPGFTGKLGVAGTKLEVDAANLIIATDQAQVHLDGDYTTGVITEIFPTSSTVTGITFGTSSSFTTLRIVGGQGTVEFAGTVTTVQMLQAGNAVLSVLSTASAFVNLVMDSGEVITSESITTADVSGGSLELLNSAGATTVNLTDSGTLRHNSTGTVATLNAFDTATLATTADNSTSSGATFTNTNLYDGTIDERSGSATTTFTNGINVIGSGLIRPDVTRILTVT
tara:strand:- start:815 stop:1663 length:849 start_codon:yes stop_codon:yes gene_type:complete